LISILFTLRYALPHETGPKCRESVSTVARALATDSGQLGENLMTRNAISRAVHCALLGSRAKAVTIGCGLFVLTTSAWGQAQPAAREGASPTDEVVVTGSRIRRDTFNSPSPVQVITREEVTSAGFSSTTEALQGNAVTTGGAQINNAFGGFVTDGGPGANTLSLRGLGPSRTLVLINGRRVAPSGTRGAVGSADLNVLPNAIIDHVEVLKDGASSIYGSDAIAGVVNVVTLPDVDGLTFEAQYNDPLDGGGEQARISAVGGVSGDRWSFGGSLEFYDRSDLTLADRDWTHCNVDGLRDPVTGQSLDFVDPLTGRPKCYPITGTGSNGVTINTIGTNTVAGVGAAGSVGTVFNRWRPNTSINTGVIGFEGVGGGVAGLVNNLNVRDTFEPRMLNESLISPAEHTTVFLQAEYQLESLGNGEIYFDFLGSQRDSEQTNYRQLALDYRRGSPLIPADLAFSQFGPDQGTSGGQPVGVRAFIGFGNDHSEQDVNFYKPSIGLRGDIGAEWRYDANVSDSKSDAQYKQESFLIDKLTFAGDVIAAPAGMDPTLVRNGLTCAINVTNPAERCIPYPPLDNALIAGSMPADFMDYIWRDVIGDTDYQETVAGVTFDGPVASLRAGEVQAAFGFEYRSAEIDDTPDPNSVSGNLYNLTSAAPTRGKDDVKEVFTEIEVPLLAGVRGVNELTFNGSLRYTDYDSYGSDNTYKAGLMYSPVEWISFRVTQGTSFRAPALYEQFQGATSGFLSQAMDPCNNYGAKSATVQANCATELPGRPDFVATSGIRVFSLGGASAGLEAETSDNLTYGIILQPELGDAGDLSVAIDYFDIEINNGVNQPGGNNILARCYEDPDFRAGGGLCRLVTRDPVTAQLTVSNAYTNIATQLAEGVDYTIRFERDVGPGVIRLNTQMTRYMEQAEKLFEEDEFDFLNGTINNPKYSANVDVTYTMGNWRFRYGVDWLDSMDSYAFLEEDPATSIYDFEVGDYQEHYMSVRYTNEEWQVTAGMRNIFDEEPPVISQGYYNRQGNAPLYSGYDYFGREAFFQLAKVF
jgi:outer membrane receptor protein involved in Fe transport